MTAFVDKLVAEEHHLAALSREGYEPATLPILLVEVTVFLAVVVGIVLGAALAAYYLS